MNKNDYSQDDLLIGGFQLLQKKDGYRFSLDAVLLAAFVPVRPGANILDLGCGSGVLPLLLLGREQDLKITAVEKMDGPYRLAKRNMAENHVDVAVIHGDMSNCGHFLASSSFDLIVTNPPFYPVSACRMPQNEEVAAAKTELFWNQRVLMEQAYSLLRADGRLILIFDGARKAEINATAKNAGLFLERSRDIFSKAAKPGPNRILLQWTKRKTAFYEDTPLTIYDEKGVYTPEMKRILENYHGAGTVSCGDAHRQS